MGSLRAKLLYLRKITLTSRDKTGRQREWMSGGSQGTTTKFQSKGHHCLLARALGDTEDVHD